jgi:hypothetical protein
MTPFSSSKEEGKCSYHPHWHTFGCLQVQCNLSIIKVTEKNPCAVRLSEQPVTILNCWSQQKIPTCSIYYQIQDCMNHHDHKQHKGLQNLRTAVQKVISRIARLLHILIQLTMDTSRCENKTHTAITAGLAVVVSAYITT